VTDASAAVNDLIMKAMSSGEGTTPGGRQAPSTHLVMEGRRSRSPRFLLPFFLMTTLALSASNASASCCVRTQQQGKQMMKKRISAYRRHQKQQDMGDGAGPQQKYGIGGIYATTGKTYLVLGIPCALVKLME
jgi:hypothetical protein